LLGTTNHPATAEATGLEVDKFDGAAVRRYLDHYLGMYTDAVGPGLVGAHGIRAFLTDSIEVGAANWTPRMIEDFKRLRGYDPTPWLPALTGALVGTRAQSDMFLYDYRRTLADLMASEHYGTVATFAHEHGLRVYGEALEDHRPSLGDDMAMRSHTDVPMSAMWTYARDKGPKPSYLADTKGAASVAHIYGQNFVAAESMTSAMTPWADSPRTLKRIIDLEFLQGINLPVVHESTHQPLDTKVPGLSLFIFGQYFNRLDAWAPLARPWVDYIARNALLLQQGHDAADIGYFYGEEAPLTGLYGDTPVADAPRTHAYDFVNADALMGALKNEGADLVTPGGARYKALYLGGSSHKMTLAALEKIASLVESGATVIGQKPEGSPSNNDDPARYVALSARLWPGGVVNQVGKGRVIVSSDVESALAGIGIAPDFRFTGGQADADVRFVHRHLKDGEAYFVDNRLNRPEAFEAHFRVTGKIPELWHAETGTRAPVSYRIANGETIVPLALDAEGAVYVVFRKAATTDQVVLKAPRLTPLAPLTGAWTVAFQPGRGAPATATLPALTPLDQNTDPAIRYFSGVATYTKDFVAPKAWKAKQPLWLDLGDVREVAVVSLNGKPVGSVWHTPYRIDISAATIPGRNHLEIKVANLWLNRLIGDAQPGVTHKITWTALPTYRADAPLPVSGLIGPVRLVREVR
ncbi:MAG: glycoside hydrolase, partial [Alphaproteobacteria bacterium]|nr:glycoside hydrolase [Alphaproteobacteria bacterium]